MKKIHLAFASALVLSAAVVGGILAHGINSQGSAPTFSAVNPYQLDIDSYAAISSGATTSKGNKINFAKSGLTSSSGVGKLTQGGYIYNTTAISGIERIDVTLTSGSVRLHYGLSSNSSWDGSIDNNYWDLDLIHPNYFKIEATSDAVISKISVVYACYDYQKDAQAIPYSVYVNDQRALGTLSNATKQGEGYKEQYKISLDVYAGDVISFKKGNETIYPSAEGNAYKESARGFLLVKDTKMAADLYLKVYDNGSYSVWLSGEGEPFAESAVQKDAILQAFNWSMDNIRNNLDNIVNAGFKAVQISPMQAHDNIPVNDGWRNHWWELYQPYSLSVAGPYQNPLGDKNQLINLCTAAKAKGVDIIVDIIVEHLGGFDPGQFNGLVDNYEHEIYSNDLMHKNGKKSNESQFDYVRKALGDYPDLKTEDSRVMKRALDLFKEYLDCGVTGFRFDAAKHVETPQDGEYASSFLPYVINGAKRYAADKGYPIPYCYGEILGANAGDDRDVQWYRPYMSVTDSTNSYDLRRGMNNGDISKIKNLSYFNLGANKSVLWAESHDLFQTDREEETTSWMSETNINKVYAVQASRADSGVIYLARPGESTNMGSLGLEWWKSGTVSAINQFRNRFAAKGEYISIDQDKKSFIAVRGSGAESGAMIVNVGNGDQSYSVQVGNFYGYGGLSDGRYIDLVSKKEYNVTGGYVTVSPGSGGICALVPITGAPTYYLAGNSTFTGKAAEWTAASGKLMVQNPQNDNEAELENVRIEEGAEVRILCTRQNADDSWLSMTLGGDYGFCTKSGDNVRFTKGGTYSFYLNAEFVLYLTGTPDAPEIDINDFAVKLGATSLTLVDDSEGEKYGDTWVKQFKVTGINASAGAVLTFTRSGNAISPSVGEDASNNAAKSQGGTITVKKAGNNLELYLKVYDNDTYAIWLTGNTPDPVSLDTLYFTDAYSWGQVYVHRWGGTGQATTWPGIKMTYVGTNEYSQKIYSISGMSNFANVIFHGNNGEQTVDLTLASFGNNNACYPSGGSGNAITVGYYTYNA